MVEIRLQRLAAVLYIACTTHVTSVAWREAGRGNSTGLSTFWGVA